MDRIVSEMFDKLEKQVKLVKAGTMENKIDLCLANELLFNLEDLTRAWGNVLDTLEYQDLLLDLSRNKNVKIFED